MRSKAKKTPTGDPATFVRLSKDVVRRLDQAAARIQARMRKSMGITVRITRSEVIREAVMRYLESSNQGGPK